MDVACVGGVGHGFSFAVWRKPALRIPTFDARGCSAMKRKRNDGFADNVQREKSRKQRVAEPCNAKNSLGRGRPSSIEPTGASGRENVLLNLRLQQPFLKINRG
jgi:hypothetical protein